MPQLRQCLRLDLADALPSHAERSPDLFEGSYPTVFEPEAHGHDLVLARRERRERLADCLVEHRPRRGVVGNLRPVVLDKIRQAEVLLLQALGREPTSEEIAARLELTTERVREIQRINQDTVSLEQPMGDEDDFSLSDLIEDRGAVVPDDAAARIMLDQAVREALAHLSPREQDVVQLRFGLDDGKIRTLEEVGKAFGVTRERIRQIEAKTLAKLRRPDSAQLLRDYLDEA